ncbi:MAG TPA: aminodeoxychorismate/anthranilate synthase component II [Roseiflexaceae bacterium]|nr:aminodeoxychorismate/anthranilate synthase component II [Roseiflexaceae bacterium]
MKALVVDAYDSFVYIIHQYLLKLGVQPTVVRNDQISLEQIAVQSPDFILLGPGPGHPADARYVDIIQRFGGHTPILGVCLGHQAIGLAFGGQVLRAEHLMHGKTSQIRHDGRGCFAARPNPLRATRYHSLIVGEEGLPPCLEITARSGDDGYIMGLRHRELPIESVQFHPESVYTQDGLMLFQNFLTAHVKARSIAA